MIKKLTTFLFLFISLSIDNTCLAVTRVLVGSPVRQSSEILREFLTSLSELNQDNLEVEYFFVDDNTEQDPMSMLYMFTQEVPNKVTIQYANSNGLHYVCNELTHYWNEDLIWKVAGFKNFIINHALQNNYDYLFLVDSDIVMHPNTLKHLIDQQKDIIAEIHWTSWQLNSCELPNVWLYDTYTLHEKSMDEQLSPEETSKRINEFLLQLRTPGVYRIGGLCACTLYSQNALKKGVHFGRINNLSFWGEDRHLCTRAAALGLELWVDTHYPSYHIYRKSLLDGVAEYKKNNF